MAIASCCFSRSGVALLLRSMQLLRFAHPPLAPPYKKQPEAMFPAALKVPRSRFGLV